jgi:capsular polysaccharide biosynthesis protein
MYTNVEKYDTISIRKRKRQATIWGMKMEQMELREYFKIIKKRWWLISVIVLISCITSGIYSYYFIQPIYSASTMLIVNKSTEYSGNQQLDLNAVNTNIQLIATYKVIIKTNAVMDKVVNQYPEFNLTSDDLVGKVSVSSVNQTQVITLTAVDNSYEKAARIVNAVSKVFKAEIPTIMKVDNVAILNEAKVNDNQAPVSPNKMLNVILSLIVSLMVSLGIVFLLDYLDDTFKTEQEVRQYLELPTFAMISKIKKTDLNPPSTKIITRQVGEMSNVTINN